MDTAASHVPNQGVTEIPVEPVTVVFGKLAEIVVVPDATPVTLPFTPAWFAIVATSVLPLSHVTCVVRSCVVESLK